MPDKKDFISIFKAETEDHLTKLDKGLVDLEKHPQDLELVKELNREVHTIKGSSRIFGFYEIQEIAHRIEDIFEKASQKKIAFNSFLAQKIFKGMDAIRAILETISKEERASVDVSEICKELETSISPEPLKKKAQESKAQVVAVTPSHPVQIEEYIRVPISRINKFLNLIGEMVINKMKSSEKISQTKRLFKLSKEAQKRVSELGDKIRKEFPLEKNSEISRLFSQCSADMQELKEYAHGLYENIYTETLHLDPVIDELQAKMKEIRMLPLSTTLEGFPRMVRDIAFQQSKEVNLEIFGDDTELDKKVLEWIKTPLMHILRNCVDHGIELPALRQALGKPKTGTMKISAFHEAGNVVIVIEDDGRGIDIDEVKRTALAKKLITEKELEKMSEKEALNLIFMNGYSTNPIITDVSGRGIGLDIVRRDMENLKGQVLLETEKGKGAKFTLVLPLTIAIIQILLVKIKGIIFGIPMTSIVVSLKVKKQELSTLEGKMAMQSRGQTVPLVGLDDALGLPFKGSSEDERVDPKELSVIIVASLDKRIGFIVDEITGEAEIFIKNLGEYLGKVKCVAGATILGKGQVVVILDVSDLIASTNLSHPAAGSRKPLPAEKRKEKRLLVVDDAFSTRELLKNIFETHGYVVDTAVDGLDGLDKLVSAKFDLVVSDVQMPRMDGFEFCQSIRKNDDYKQTPVIIITALDREEDKRRGIEVGASAYIVKSVFDQTNLLDAIERLIG
jgi:two-component system chemotaxis sensor kinase CheA